MGNGFVMLSQQYQFIPLDIFHALYLTTQRAVIITILSFTIAADIAIAQDVPSPIGITSTKYFCKVGTGENTLLQGARLRVSDFDKAITAQAGRVAKLKWNLTKLLTKTRKSAKHQAKIATTRRELDTAAFALVELAKCRNGSPPYASQSCTEPGICDQSLMPTNVDFLRGPVIETEDLPLEALLSRSTCAASTKPVAISGETYSGVAGSAVTLTGRAQFDQQSRVIGYYWQYGDGTEGPWLKYPSANHTYLKPGSYTAKLWFLDNCFRLSQKPARVAVTISPLELCPNNTAPIALVSGPTTGEIGQLLSFNGNLSFDGDGTIFSYAWDFADGTLSATANASHSYATAAARTIRLTVTDNCGATSSATHTVSILTPPPPASAMATASRINGVAPLAVFFDAVASTNGVIQPTDGDYASLHYHWNFGDSSAAKWTRSTDRHRNQSIGPIAGHVYDSPGQYLATLTVTTLSGMQHFYQQLITVSDAATELGWTTYYVSALGNDSNNGTSPDTPIKTFGKATSKVGAKARILFRRGDSWTVNPGMQLSGSSGIIGAYGDAAAAPPFIQTHDYISIFKLSGPDWRIIDLSLKAPAYNPAGDTDYGAPQALAVDGGVVANRYILVQGVTIDGSYTGFVNTYFPLPISHDHTFLVDNELKNQGNKGVFIGGTRNAIIGNYMHHTGSHILRDWHGIKTVIAENSLTSPLDPNGAVIKFHNAQEVNNLPDGRYNLISGNIIQGQIYSVTIGTQGGWANEKVRDSIIERNLFLGSPKLKQACRINAQNITVRNNIGDLSGALADDTTLFSVEQWGAEPPPTGARIYNNIVYRSDSGFAQLLKVGRSDTIIANNIAYADSGLVRLGYANANSSNNLNANPHWLNSVTWDFQIGAGSPARNGGTIAPVLDDYQGELRGTPPYTNSEGALDIGCYEYRP